MFCINKGCITGLLRSILKITNKIFFKNSPAPVTQYYYYHDFHCHSENLNHKGHSKIQDQMDFLFCLLRFWQCVLANFEKEGENN